ncbi:MAG: NHL repeat-containing protein [Thermomicrobiales bacterium]
MAAKAPNGDIYVTNTATHQVLRFAPDGQLITAWGSEGTSTGQFKTPAGIGVDGDSNVYVADSGNHRIQKFDANGAFILAWGSEGIAQGQFNNPYGLAVGPDGTIYVTERGNNRIQRFGPSGNPVRMWGGLGSLAGQFVTPHGIAVNGALVYVADTGNQRVQIFDVDGGFQGSFGQAGTGNGQFSLPLGLTVAGDGTVYVSDIGDDRIQVFTVAPVVAPAQNRVLSAIQYEYAGSVGDAGQFNNPIGLGFDGHGRLMVADASNNALKFFVSNSITSRPGPFVLADTWVDDTRGRFSRLLDMEQGPDGRVYVSDMYEMTQDSLAVQIQVFGPDGAYLEQWRGLMPSGLAFDSEGNLFTFNVANGRMEKFSPDGAFLEGWGPANPQTRVIYSSVNIAIDADDNVYVAHASQGIIQKFSADGTYLDAWGSPGNQPGQLLAPRGLAIHGDRIYVADSGNYRIQVFDLNGVYIRHWGSEGTGDGQFDGVADVAVDAYGFVFATDSGNNRVRSSRQMEFFSKWEAVPLTGNS